MKRYFKENDKSLLSMIDSKVFLDNINAFELSMRDDCIMQEVHRPTSDYCFLHETAIIEYKGVLFASWYNNEKVELFGRSPIRGRRSSDGGKTWSDVEVIIDDPSGKILYCPPVYGICDGKLYMFVNEMISADFMHALDLFVYDEASQKFKMLWSKPIPFKINTNVQVLPNGKLMLPGRIAELDSFPNTPAVLISDSGKIDAEWRLVKIMENGNLPNGNEFEHPECSAIINNGKIYMFCRNTDRCIVPLVFISEDNAETWKMYSHDIPFADSKIYSGTLSDGRNYVIGNIMPDRKKLAILFSKKGTMHFDKAFLLADNQCFNDYNGQQWSYPCAYESQGKLYVIYSATIDMFEQECRGAMLSIIDLSLI